MRFASASLPPCKPHGAQIVRSTWAWIVAVRRMRTSLATPRPPRNLPAPPESWRNVRRSMMIGLLASVASTGELCVSPSLRHTVAFMPSSSDFAPQPPPGWPMCDQKNRPVCGVETVRVDRAQIGVMAGDGALGTGGRRAP